MKINSPPEIPVALSSQAQSVTSKASQGAAKANSDASSVGVSVTVSIMARSLEVSNKGEPADVDTEKVNAVRAKIEQGTYKVNAQVIADKLLANAQEMLDRNRN